MKLDNWTDDQVNTFVSMGGNTDVNRKYEAGLVDGYRKPKPDSCIEERFEFIRYCWQMTRIISCGEESEILWTFY